MKNRIYDALNTIKAEDKLKQDTYAFLRDKINRKKKIAFKKIAVAFASIMLVFFAGLLSYNIYFAETAFVDIDVNPGIELTLNRFDRVIGVYAYNEDGKEVLDNVNIKNRSYKDALEILIDKMVEMGYINDDGLFTATFQANDGRDEKEWLDSMKVYIDSLLQSQNVNVEQDVFIVDSDIKTHSHEKNITPAKYLAILELQAVDPTATFDSCRNHTISEIKQQAHGHTNGSHEPGNGSQGHTSSGSNHGVNDSDDNYNAGTEHESSPNTNNHQQVEDEHAQAPSTGGTTQHNENHNSGNDDSDKH